MQLYCQAAWCLGLSVEKVPVLSVSWGSWRSEFNHCSHQHGLQKVFLSQLTSVVIDQISRPSWAVSSPVCNGDMVSGGRLQGYRCLRVLEVFSPEKPALCTDKGDLCTSSFASVCAGSRRACPDHLAKPFLWPPWHAQKWLHLVKRVSLVSLDVACPTWSQIIWKPLRFSYNPEGDFFI